MMTYLALPARPFVHRNTWYPSHLSARLFTAANSDAITVPIAASIHNVNTFTLLCWFRAAADRAASHYIYQDRGGFPVDSAISLNTSGQINVFWRSVAGTQVNISSAASYDDNLWHWMALVRRSSADWTIYADGVVVATSGTDIVSGTVTDVFVGNNATNTWSGRLSRFATFTYAMGNVDEMLSFLLYGRVGRQANLWFELGGPLEGGLEHDWSGNAFEGTITGTSVDIGPPIPNWFRSVPGVAISPGYYLRRRIWNLAA